MSKSKQQPSSPSLKVEGSIVENGCKLRWKPVPRAKAYSIGWLDKSRKWVVLWTLVRDEAAPTEDGFVEYVDDCPGPMGPGGTYRVTAYFNLEFEGKTVASSPVVITSHKPKRSTLDELTQRIKRKPWPAEVKALIASLKWSQHGWKTLVPKAAGQCLGKRIEAEVRHPQLTDEVLDLLALIFSHLPKLASRAEKAFNDYGGPATLDEEDEITRPRIVIGDLHVRKPDGTWMIVIEIKGSDFGWHIEFVRTGFKEIWSGD